MLSLKVKPGQAVLLTEEGTGETIRVVIVESRRSRVTLAFAMADRFRALRLDEGGKPIRPRGNVTQADEPRTQQAPSSPPGGVGG